MGCVTWPPAHLHVARTAGCDERDGPHHAEAMALSRIPYDIAWPVPPVQPGWGRLFATSVAGAVVPPPERVRRARTPHALLQML